MIMLLKNSWPILLLLLLAIFLFLPQLINNSIPYTADFTGSDLVDLNIPARYLAAAAWRQGEVPLWSKMLGDGWPLLAEGQAGVFYPFNLILYPLLPLGLAINLGLIINFWLAGWFSYLYARILRLSRFAALFTAIAFGYSGWFVFHLQHLNLINAAIWLPLIFYLIEKYFSSQNKSRIVIFLSLVFTIQFFAGHPQVSYISVFSATVYFFLKAFILARHDQIKLIKTIYRALIVWSIVGILTFGLSAVQFLPTAELTGLSGRSAGLDYQKSLEFPFQPANFLTIFNPYIFGNPAVASYQGLGLGTNDIFWENNLYFGLLALLLAFYYLFVSVRNRSVNLVFISLLLIGTFFVLGGYAIFYSAVWQILPGLKFFRVNQRFLLLLILTMSIFAGLGFDLIRGKIKRLINNDQKLNQSKFLAIGLAIIAVLILVVDLFFQAYSYIGLMSADYFTPPPSVEILKQDNDIFRISSVNYQNSWQSVYQLSGGWLNNLSLYQSHRGILPPNLNAVYGVMSYNDRVWAEGGQAQKRLSDVWQEIDSGLLFSDNTDAVIIPKGVMQVLGLQNVKYLLSFSPLKSDYLILKQAVPNGLLPAVKIYENRLFLPMAFMVFDSPLSTLDNNALLKIFDDQFNSSRQMLVQKPILLSNHSDVDARVEITEFTNQKISLEVETAEAGLLFLSQTFYPGWQVMVDNRPRELLRADYAWSAVEISPGVHQVKFVFKSQSYIMGKNISLITLLLIIIWLLNNISRSPKKVIVD